MLIIIYLILLILGAKATWELVLRFFPTSIDGGILFAILLFVIPFLIIGPIMGIITSVKYIIIYFSSMTSKTKEKPMDKA